MPGPQEYHWYYQEPSWSPGPSEIQNQIGFLQAETPYKNQIESKRESSRTFSKDAYTDLYPCMA